MNFELRSSALHALVQNTMHRSTAPTLLCGSLLLLAACQRTATPSDPTSVATLPPAAQQVQPPTQPSVREVPGEVPAAEPDWGTLHAQLGPASLMSWQELDGRCDWAVSEPPQFKARLFMRTPGCPSTLVWHKSGGQSLFALDGVIYLHDWQAAKVTALGAPPIDGSTPELGFSNSGALRFCVQEQRPYQGREDTVEIYRAIWERTAEGPWRRTLEVPIDYEELVRDTCSGDVDPLRAGSVDYKQDFASSSECGEQRLPEAQCPPNQAMAQFRAQVPGEYEGFEYTSIASGRFLAYPYYVGDGPLTPLSPVFAIQDEQLTRIYGRVEDGASLNILICGDRFLLRSAGSLQYASLFERGSTTPLLELPDKARVIWIPGSVAAAPLIEVAAR